MEKVFIAIPHTGEIRAELGMWMMDQLFLKEYEGMMSMSNYRPVENNRNRIAADFIKSGCGWMMCIDSDVVPPRDAVKRLLGSGKEVISGLYWTYQNGVRKPLILKKVGEVVEYVEKHEGVKEVDATGLGCCLIKREVVEAVVKRWGYFCMSRFNKAGELALGEDYDFFLKVKELGYKVWMDCRVECDHYGEVNFKRIYIKADEKLGEYKGMYVREGNSDEASIEQAMDEYRGIEDYRGKVVMDIGANIGGYMKVAIERGAKEVICYEPDTETHSVLCRNVERIGGGKVKVHEAAVGEREGMVNLYKMEKGGRELSGLNSTHINWGGRSELVRMLNFKKVIKQYRPDIVKIDIEGGEYDIDFKGIDKCVKVLYIEIHAVNKEMERAGLELEKVILAEGFRATHKVLQDKAYIMTYIR